MSVIEEEKPVSVPAPLIKTRPVDQTFFEKLQSEGVDPLLARIIAARPVPPSRLSEEILKPRLKFLEDPHSMIDIHKAASRVAEAIMRNECIGIETDHDCDGQTAHAVLYHNLVQHFGCPPEKIRSYIGHRMKEGYGLSQLVANRILQDDPKPTLLITADNGSTDEPRIQQLKAAGIDVIVTDHHQIPSEGIPISAFACLNPTRKDCGYPDPYIAGCMVAWLLMTVTRKQLIERMHLKPEAPTLMDTLDFVAVGTVADCVSLARSTNNRAVIHFGLKLIEAGQRPCWRALKESMDTAITAEDIAFRVAPLLNSDGRLATAFGSVSFLLSETDAEAHAWLTDLSGQNNERKAIQRQITEQGLKIAAEQVAAGRKSLCIFLEQGHSGVHGISASRIREMFGRPTIFLTPKATDPEWVTGSARGMDGFHVRDALQAVSDAHPNVLSAFGGHQGAGGLTLRRSHLDLFMKAFEEAAKKQLQNQILGPVIWTDGEISAEQLSWETWRTLQNLEPYGREFDAPVFQVRAVLVVLNPVGDGTHAKVSLNIQGAVKQGIWFRFRPHAQAPFPVAVGASVLAAVRLKTQKGMGNLRLDICVEHLTALQE